jgi:hypothetical protein
MPDLAGSDSFCACATIAVATNALNMNMRIIPPDFVISPAGIVSRRACKVNAR